MHKDYRHAKMLRHSATFSLLTAGGALAGGSSFLGAPPEMGIGAAAMTLVSAGGLQVGGVLFVGAGVVFGRSVV